MLNVILFSLRTSVFSFCSLLGIHNELSYGIKIENLVLSIFSWL